MPRGDRTGPAGMGPMTGRAAGYCAGYPTPGFMNPYGMRFGRGMAWGRGGRWHRWNFPYAHPYAMPPYPYYGQAPYSAPEEEMEMLQEHAKVIEDQLNGIQKRISELEAELKKAEK